MSDAPNFPDHPDYTAGLERLADQVGVLTDAVDRESRVRADQHDATNRQLDAIEQVDRRFRRVFALVALVALVGALATTGVWARNAVVTCQNTNVARSAIREAFGSYTDALVAVPPEIPLTVEELAARETRVANFRADVDSRLMSLEPRDCSVRGAMFPRQVQG